MCVCVCACVCDSLKKHSSRTAPLCNPRIEQRTLRHLLTSRNFCLRPSLSSATGRLGSDPLAGELVGCLCFVDAGRSHEVVGQRRGALLLAVQQASVLASVSLAPQVPVGGAGGTRLAASQCTEHTESQEGTPEPGERGSLSKDVCSLLQKETWSLSSKATCSTNSLDMSLRMGTVGISSHRHAGPSAAVGFSPSKSHSSPSLKPLLSDLVVLYF